MNRWTIGAASLCFVLTLAMFYVGYYNNRLSLIPAPHLLRNAVYKSFDPRINSSAIKYKSKRTEPMVILITNGGGGPHGQWPFSLFPPGKVQLEKCPLQSHCIYTHDRNYKNKIDAIVSHNYDINWLKILKAERPNSIFVFFRQESPINTPGMGPHLDNIFSFTASFRYDSDIRMPYLDVLRIPLEKQSDQLINYAKGKTKLAITFMSNCVSFRMKLIETLKKYVNVTFYGRCHDSSCQRNTPNCESIQKSHKFYLSLENSYCSDYVTEKFYEQGLIKGLVPVVLNKGKLNDVKIAPPKSFINILDFKSTKDLADYLLYLDKNDTAYNEYHQWRNEYRVQWQDYKCNMCKQLWELKDKGRFGQSNVKLSEFWSGQKHCIGYGDKMFQKYLT